MARLKTGLLVQRLTECRRYADQTFTQFRVRGPDSPYIHTVTVDREALWSCDCQSNRFRGICYHVNLIQFEMERNYLLQKLKAMRHDPAVVFPDEFNFYMAMPRFVAEPLYEGPRQYLLLARYVYLGGKRRAPWETGLRHIRLAGTILEGVWDAYEHNPPKFRVFDCLYYKGLNHVHSFLALRRELAEQVVQELANPDVIMTEYASDPADKEKMLQNWGVVLLKDIRGPYDLSEKSPRHLMLRSQYGKSNLKDIPASDVL